MSHWRAWFKPGEGNEVECVELVTRGGPYEPPFASLVPGKQSDLVVIVEADSLADATDKAHAFVQELAPIAEYHA